MSLERKPYTGSTRRLVLAFDVGTTYSGISYCILQPGQIPQPLVVAKYPKQGQVGDLKVPSVVYYDRGGNLKAAGYEALSDETVEDARTNGWVKLEWWKLHLRPKHLSSTHINDNDIPPLPPGKSALDVLKDFIVYLFQCAEAYILESHPRHIWLSVKDDIHFVFTHPNGWEGAQQQQIRRAIELARLIPNTPEGRSRVRLLTEGEASLHFCISNLHASGGLVQGRYPKGQGVVVIDAGGGTIDLSMYLMRFGPMSVEEIAPAECHLQGSAFVTRRAKALFQRKLQGSRFSSPDIIEEITTTFDQKTKLDISTTAQPAYIKVGSLRDNDPEHDIRNGKLKISWQEATKLFDDSISTIIKAFEYQRKQATSPITLAFLVGGFGASDWLGSQLEAYFRSQGIELSRPKRAHKAVPDGAISFFLDRLVTMRVARATYGTDYSANVDQMNAEHTSRRQTWYTGAAGRLLVPNAFEGILRRGVQVNEQKEFRHSFCFNGETKESLGNGTVTIYCYRGTSPDPKWFDREKESFTSLCTVRVDISGMANALTPQWKATGGFYYAVDFDVIILFGGTEFSAQVAWKVNGAEKRCPAALIYDES